MDGAMKFVRGDAVAGLGILAVNILGGLGVGIWQRGMDAGRALETYTILTIGEGLVAQIPALLTATAAGVVVTRVAAEDEPAPFGRELGRQLGRHPRALALAAALLGLLAFAPGLPFPPLALLAAALGVVAWPRWNAPARSAFFTQLGLGSMMAGIALYAFLADEHPFYLLAVLAPVVAALPLPGRPMHGPAGAYVLSLLGVTALTHVVFFGEDRYHLVVTPLLCILSAAALRGGASGTTSEAPARSAPAA